MTLDVLSPSAAAVSLLSELETDHPQTSESLQRSTRWSSRNHRWGVILAGGDGNRLRSLSRLVSGDDRPKQFCRLLGDRTLVDEARHRIASCIPPDQTVFALTATHRDYFACETGMHLGTKLIQPYNRGTAPPIVLSLLHIACIDTEAVVAIVPSDHHYSDDRAFRASLDRAFDAAQGNRDSVLVLGANAYSPETEFGWIELGRPAGRGIFGLRRFCEKPDLATAERLLREGALWNTFIMVGRLINFLFMITDAVPELVKTLGFALEEDERGREIRILRDVYDDIEETDFARQVLTLSTDRLLAMRIEGYEWHDLGHPDRVLRILHSRKSGLPSWLDEWETKQLNLWATGSHAPQGRPKPV